MCLPLNPGSSKWGAWRMTYPVQLWVQLSSTRQSQAEREGRDFSFVKQEWTENVKMEIKFLHQCPAYHMHLLSVTKWKYKGLARSPKTRDLEANKEQWVEGRTSHKGPQ